jgi:hypothetical protein
LFAEKKEFFLRISLFFVQYYTNIIDRTFNDYECNAFIPSEILCFFNGALSVSNINSKGIYVWKGTTYKCSCCKNSLSAECYRRNLLRDLPSLKCLRCERVGDRSPDEEPDIYANNI